MRRSRPERRLALACRAGLPLVAFLIALVSGVSLSPAAEISRKDLYLGGSAGAAEPGVFRPRGDVEPWRYSLPIDWNADPFNDRNWRFQLHAWRMTDPFLREYFRTGSTGPLAEALAIVEDWHDYHAAHEETPFSWYDMAAGIRALRIAFFLDLIERGKLTVGEESRAKLEALAREHAERLQDDDYISAGNHGLFQVFGLDLLCGVAAVDECRGARRYAKEKFEWILDQQYTQQGVHKEHSPSYHGFVGRVVKSLGGAARFTSGKASALLARAAAVRPWLAFPDGRWVRAGDSDGKTAPLEAIDPGNRRCLADDRCFAVADIERSGYAIVRSLPSLPKKEQTSMLFVTGMAYSTTHKHADELSFELYEFGRPVFIDSGKYGYNQDDRRAYVVSAAAHNTISFADTPVAPTDIRFSGGLLDETEPTDEGFVIGGSIDRPGLFRQSRRIVYDPGRSLTITDRVEGNSWAELLFSPTDRYVSSLHLAPDLEPRIEGRGFVVDVGPGRVRAGLVEDDCEIDSVRGQARPLLGWASRGYLKLTPATVVRALCPAGRRTITWKIEFLDRTSAQPATE